MITFPRRLARRLRGVFRRNTLGISTRGILPPLFFHAEETQLRVQHYHASLAVEYVHEENFVAPESIALPLDALADFEGRGDTTVALEAVRPDSTVVRWEDHGIPMVREYHVPAIETASDFPALPVRLELAPGNLLDALVEASRTCDDSSTRYALACILLRGDAQQIVATNGRELLIQGGYHFPWSGDALVKNSPVLSSKEFGRIESVAIGRTETHLVLRVGPWTLYLELQTEGRYPEVDTVLPDDTSAIARLSLDPDDAAFLLPALDRLPGASEQFAPATLDLNGKIAIRARGDDQPNPTELVLSRSRHSGSPMQIHTDRRYLARAIRLGLSELAIADARSPVVCRNGARTYGWQPLSAECVIEPSDSAVRIESAQPSTSPAPTSPPDPTSNAPKGKTHVSASVKQPKTKPKAEPATNGHITPDRTGSSVTGLAALIKEAEAVHEELSGIRARSKRLMVALRKHRRHERLVASTLASLKELKLQEVSG